MTTLLGMTIEQSSQIAQVQRIIGYDIYGPLLLREALQAPDLPVVSNNERHLGYEGNMRLALVGNAVMKLLRVDRGYDEARSAGMCD